MNLLYLVLVVIAIATLEGVILSFVARRDYDWRAALASLGDILGPPGWRPDGRGFTSADLRRSAVPAE
jgi:hypothetical protein